MYIFGVNMEELELKRSSKSCVNNEVITDKISDTAIQDAKNDLADDDCPIHSSYFETRKTSKVFLANFRRH